MGNGARQLANDEMPGLMVFARGFSLEARST
jgi:hypothetical protein